MKPTKKLAQPIKLTPALLKSIIEEEVKGFGDMEDVEKRAEDTDELDADEQADGVERAVDWKKANHIKESGTLDGELDYMKALKIEEGRLTVRLAKVRSSLASCAKKLVIARVV
jgi:hypothetical protein